ncbi:hypothetical protein LTR10_013438 [Elasticomyces elasticus]|uniref:C2H2 type master regulator of conidiophore development brlA n=1 Tax=Exophiala sideris TaxID=1016849 RepID=A0ABR0J4G2_9EURO|nr:hypothetical protein LTR10_013438 [Elasticomyces elasticus]KAK5027332.1 hypothetical protein LTS07_006934 [Exophiala sideris]KAK5034966.1 hypothetical protein LTR13_006148 [Exophiala sideris]KAK5056300.1 hypothetical protein LTR69_007841 [Exophiala sideris]KAK5181211.1 hypothetical protein LTR44_006542 [Eurotiomycetes sp. CCFEE 6388]
MGGANSYKPSLPPFRELMESVSEKAENDQGKGRPPSPVFDHPRRVSGSSQGYSTSPDRPEIARSPRHFPPPTSELPPASNFDLPRPSPTNISPVSAPGRSDYYPPTSTSTNPGVYAQRTPTYPPMTTEPAQPYPPVHDAHSWAAAHPPRPVIDTMQQDQAPVRAPSAFNEVSIDSARFNGVAQQRPLPPSFPPPMQGAALPPLEGMLPGPGLPPMDPQMAPTWQHHHFYPPANPPAYPQAQERYICPTCRKPFSRPSSLRIHGHSHSGEKPYVCKYPGCGKSFSVRSNMKRHERGCHGGESGSGAGPGSVSGSGSINNGDSSATSR